MSALRQRLDTLPARMRNAPSGLPVSQPVVCRHSNGRAGAPTASTPSQHRNVAPAHGRGAARARRPASEGPVGQRHPQPQAVELSRNPASGHPWPRGAASPAQTHKAPEGWSPRRRSPATAQLHASALAIRGPQANPHRKRARRAHPLGPSALAPRRSWAPASDYGQSTGMHGDGRPPACAARQTNATLHATRPRSPRTRRSTTRIVDEQESVLLDCVYVDPPEPDSPPQTDALCPGG